MRFLRYLYILILGSWVGALIFFGAAVAPTLFRTIGAEHAAAVVRQLIPTLDIFALAGGPVLVLLCWIGEGKPRGVKLFRTVVLTAISVLAALSMFTVSPKMAALRAEVGNRISTLPESNPLRKQFGQLHGFSTTMMLAELLLGLVAIAIQPGPQYRART